MHYTWDVFEPLPDFFLRYAPYCRTAFTNRPDAETLKSKGFDAEYLPYGFDDCVYTPFGTQSDAHGAIVFMGNDHEDRYPLGALRRQIVEHLSAKYPNFKVYGHGWGAGVKNYYFSPSKEAEAYRSCIAAINLSSYDRSGYSSDRILRAMGCGACVLSKSIPDGHPPGMSNGFTHLEWKTAQDLCEQIDYVLKNRVLAAVIGKRASDLVHSMHRFDSVIANMETILLK